MSKDKSNSTFDFDNDPEFSDKFYKNIEKVLSDDEVSEEDFSVKDNVEEEKTADTLEAPEAASVEEDSAALEQSTDEDAEKIDNELTDINASLAKQISDELDTNKVTKGKKSRRFKILTGVLIALVCIIGIGSFLAFTKPGNQLLIKMGVDLSGKIWATMTNNFDQNISPVQDTDTLDDEDKNSTAPEVDPSKIVWPQHPGNGMRVDGVYNILLLGEEAIDSNGARGRTDVIVVATLNTIDKSVKLTSLMRDMLVQIPGYQDNKLNSAYEKGGINLLYETIALNFDIHIDGCVKVGFDNFEKIIDRLGGLDLTLTAEEAHYLDTTNYISKPQNRTLVEGTQHMNGNQVLGYARVRKRATITGNNNDYGRTDRHRIVLNAIFEKYKTKSQVDLAQVMFSMLPMITTDIDSNTFKILLNDFIEMRPDKIQQLRIPADHTFTENVRVRGMDVLIPDLDQNIDVLHKFIFGDNVVSNTSAAGTNADGTATNSSTNTTSTTNSTTSSGGTN
ncbi:MAG TPA: LCP family protein [Mobilitalea sp.]|nr:LCP family protein [Mobilitalea sp.]